MHLFFHDRLSEQPEKCQQRNIYILSPYMVVSLRNNSAWKIREKGTRQMEKHTSIFFFLEIIMLLRFLLIQNLTELRSEVLQD